MKNSNNKRLPKSTATNAYDLLSEVADVVTEEPRRLAMALWRVTEENANQDDLAEIDGFPACGTVGCIGGWIETLREDVTAEQALALTSEMQNELFYDKTLCHAMNQQTVAHAQDTVAHIRRFQEKYADHLKATQLPKVGL